jgi:hypothetical protein
MRWIQDMDITYYRECGSLPVYECIPEFAIFPEALKEVKKMSKPRGERLFFFDKWSLFGRNTYLLTWFELATTDCCVRSVDGHIQGNIGQDLTSVALE